MQIRASTALRNEYLQISQLAKVCPANRSILRTRAKPIWSFRALKPMSCGKKMLAHRASVLEAELDRLSGAPTYSPEQVRGRMKEIFDAARVSD